MEFRLLGIGKGWDLGAVEEGRILALWLSGERVHAECIERPRGGPSATPASFLLARPTVSPSSSPERLT